MAYYARIFYGGLDMTTKNLTILGFVLSFFVPLAGLIICAVALKKMKEEGSEENKGLAIAGLVIGIVSMALVVLYIGCVGCAICAGVAAGGY